MTQRHVASFPQFDETECATFGPLMQVLQRTLLDVTGARQIYLANMNASTPHFHCHIIPRYHEMPLGADAWKVFDLSRASLAGEYVVDDEESLRICGEVRERLKTLA
jgi:diadenosine tetraphosphate (Ap4A) HIT family hydrolase